MTTYCPLHTCHNYRNAFESHHWSDVSTHLPRFLNQTHTMKFWYTLRQRSRPSFYPTSWSKGNSAWYQIFCFCKVKVSKDTFELYKSAVVRFCVCLSFSRCYSIRIISQIPVSLAHGLSFPLVWWSIYFSTF